MVILELKMRNVFLFESEHLDLTINKRPSTNTIEMEYLNGFPKIKYKKVNIIMGPNSSGKTKLGDVICAITELVREGKTEGVLSTSGHFGTSSEIEITILEDRFENKYIKRVKVVFDKEKISLFQLEAVELKSKSKTYIKYKEELELICVSKTEMEIIRSINENLINTAYSFSFEASKTLKHDIEDKILFKLLKNFDPSIEEVKKLDGEKRYQIKFENGDYLTIEDGKVANEERISSGTLEAIHVVNRIVWVSQNDGIYYYDEMMTRVHSELEMAVLNLFIQLVSKHNLCQLFFTTHNFEILDLNVPIHSFTFLRDYKIIYPIDTFNKNDRNFKKKVMEDYFDTIPSTYDIDSVLDVLL